MAGWFTRFKHGRGFGIHSPFAYRFVRECLNERCSYYAYAQLPDKADRLLFRVAVRFAPASIAEVGMANVSPALVACPKTQKKAPSEAAFIVAGEGAWPVDILCAALDRGAVIMVTARKAAQLPALLAHMDAQGHGMTFTNGRGVSVLVPDSKLPRQDFAVRF